MILELIERLTNEAAKQNLDFLIIGGQAIGILGYPRLTMDIDFLITAQTRADWENLLRSYNYDCYSEGTGFAQFHGKVGWPRIDLMLVDETTFEKISNEARKTKGRRTPSPRHMVALKLHATRSTSRDPEKLAQDWQDIRKIVERHKLDPTEPDFADLIRRYGGSKALERIRRMCEH